MRYIGEPDPTWRPHDRNILDDLYWTLQTIRGRTKDAKFDRQLWQKLFERSTDEGQKHMAEAFKRLEDDKEKGPIRPRIIGINKMSDTSFDVRWEETRETLAGQVSGKPTRWRGIFRVQIDVGQTRDALQHNPKGVWMDGWSIEEDKF
jgi:type IV secretory pathway TrbF-like protein